MGGLTWAFSEKMVPTLHIRAAELGTVQKKQQQWTTAVSIWGGLTDGGHPLRPDSWVLSLPEDKTLPGVNTLAEQPPDDQKSSSVG